MNVWDIYEDLTDIGAVRTFIENQMDDYNASSGVVRLNLILFRDAVEHICRIFRVISQVILHLNFFLLQLQILII